MTNPTIISVDTNWEIPLQDFLITLHTHSGTIISFIPEGPAGGNPEITASFPTSSQALAYLIDIGIEENELSLYL